jgi:hypothetical protein
MANFLRRNVLAAVSLVAALALSGCYTEVGSVRGERDEDYAYHPEDQGVVPDTTMEESGNYTDNEYDRDRSRFYFDYYYPSFTFGLGYYSWWRPWWSWGSWYYDPFYYYGGYYAPWGWGGYPGYVPGWWYPHYDGRFALSPGYYGRSRTFGNSRTVGMTRGTFTPSGGIMYGRVRSSSSTGGRTGVTSGRSQTGSPSARPSTRVSPGRRSQSSSRYVAPSYGGTVNRGNRGQARREYVQPRSGSAQRREGRSGGNRSSGSSGRSYSPPASMGSSHSSPAPSGGGGGSRGGSGGSGGGGGRHSGGRR